MKIFLSVLFLVFGFAMAADATVLLGFSAFSSGGIASNFANASNVPTNGMEWGIVVETVGSTFTNGGTSYNAYSGGPLTAGFLSANGTVSNDYFVPGGTTFDSTASKEGDGTTHGAAGTISAMSSFALTNGMAPGDKFALVWFSTNSSGGGDKYGFFTDATFVLPADGTPFTSYDGIFTGVDPVRGATDTFVVTPEPSRILLVGLGALSGLMVRRRRVAA